MAPEEKVNDSLAYTSLREDLSTNQSHIFSPNFITICCKVNSYLHYSIPNSFTPLLYPASPVHRGGAPPPPPPPPPPLKG